MCTINVFQSDGEVDYRGRLIAALVANIRQNLEIVSEMRDKFIEQPKGGISVPGIDRPIYVIATVGVYVDFYAVQFSRDFV